VSKRILVTALFLIVGAMLITAAGTRAAPATLDQTVQQPSGGSIVGSWVLNIAGGPAPEIQVISFTSDGIVVTSNTPTQPVQPGQGPPGVGRTYSTDNLGVWSQTGDHQFLITMVSVNYDETGAVVNSVKVIGALTTDAAGDSLSGQFRIEGFDPMGNLQFASPGPVAQFTGTRIVAEPF
jgi:hypothetical protein